MSCHLQYYIGCTSMDPSYALTEVQTMMYIPDSSPISWWPIIFLTKEEIDFQGKQLVNERTILTKRFLDFFGTILV